MTPSQLAKKFAAEHGYTIGSHDGKFVVIRNDDGHTIGERAKYDGVLKLMWDEWNERKDVPLPTSEVMQMTYEHKFPWLLIGKNGTLTRRATYSDAVKFLRLIFQANPSIKNEPFRIVRV